jgi:hypothetical protein
MLTLRPNLNRGSPRDAAPGGHWAHIIIRSNSSQIPTDKPSRQILDKMLANVTADVSEFSNKCYDILVVGGGTAGLALASR